MIQASSFVLASSSPRRHQILSQLGFKFNIVPSTVIEHRKRGELPESFVARMASAKAEEVARRLSKGNPGAYILGADTIVVIDNEILGKPKDQADAQYMITRLEGKTHQVITAVALHRVGSAYRDHVLVKTSVVFRHLDVDTISGYVATGDGLDKAGGYAIQGLGMGLVSEILGSYSNVVGLPAPQTISMLVRSGLVQQWP